MLFNSIDFVIFLPIVFLLYWFVTNRNLKLQNLFLLIASYVFYGWWDWRFLSLIIFSSLVDYTIGNLMGQSKSGLKRKSLLILSLCVNLGLLGVFKYYNFFAESFEQAFTFMGSTFHANRLNIVLPVGISFYTFQTLSYTIDVYRNKLEPTKNIISFFAFVSFFPQLVAGPIERASNLLPQFSKKRVFNYHIATDGMRQILWGLFKKIVIADNCAVYVNEIFDNYQDYNGSTLLLGGILFAFQIYCDFSGYSDIAIGVSRLFGFNLMKNFAFPYFSRDIAEFWRRWHISLSTWFRDYLYIPLGGSKGSTSKKIRNIFIIFLVSGFWHGANWTFIVWGFLNALYFLPLMLLNKNRINTNTVAEGNLFANMKEISQIGITFFITVIAWIFFRAENVSHAFSYLGSLFSRSFFELPNYQGLNFIYLGLIIALVVVEWLQRNKEHGLELNTTWISKPVRWSLYIVIILVIVVFGNSQQEFIYFQF
ncbi:membrane-bound O-acyltransferase family protein [Hanstruepera neustonica]|uniref:Membrane-bound O-acyltransferase family protein n=1 Tax=Hanstruepera neustonica TaxID=1445657 RepID=A0A2K1E0T7_9FLAO|nr:MBOAT family O-acyltransferase [Hanstruepera neustonica]PNQ73889.1 membrane-bound O-acyltransferase family protein [Hanstruepera neustonica]